MTQSHFEGEKVIITFEKEDSSSIKNMEGRITSFGVKSGTSEVESIPVFGGAFISVQKPSGEYEVTVDYVTRDNSMNEILMSTSSAAGLPPSNVELRSGNEASKKRWRVIFWFLGESNIPLKTGSVVVPSKTGELLRYIFKDVYSVSADESFDADGYFKGTLTLKCAAGDEDGYGNVFKEYTAAQSTSALTVLNATAHKGTLTWSATTTRSWDAGGSPYRQ